MRAALTILGLLAMGSSLAAAPSLLPDRVDKAIQERIAAGEYPALVVAVVDGDRSDVHAYGKLDDGKAPDAGSVFEIGSATKTFTATLLAREIVEGKLKADAPVATLLPDFKLPVRNGKAITLENLAMQDSGLPRVPTNLQPKNKDDPYADYDGAKLKSFLAAYVLPRDPGSTYEYSNLGVGLLGYALAQHAGTSYDALLRARIFDPLAMKSSSAAMTDSMRAHLAGGHDDKGKRVANWNFDALAGCGAIRSSAADMLRYLQANMGLLKSPLFAAMQLAQQPRADAAGERIGLVWMTRHDASGDVIWHNGMTGGYASFIGFSADRRHGVVVLTNAALPVDDLGFATLQADAALAAVHRSIPITAQVADQYVGSYQLAPGFVLRIFRTGNVLYGQATGQGPFELFASASDEFFAKVGDIGISFRRDASHKVDALVLHQHGESVAPRLSDAQAEAAAGHASIALDAATLAKYVGHYQLAPQATFTITLKDGQLFSQLSGQGAYPIYASAKDKFFYKVVDAQIDFERDAKGHVVALVLHQNGADQRAKRIED